jgi:hypothetical protein
MPTTSEGYQNMLFACIGVGMACSAIWSIWFRGLKL